MTIKLGSTDVAAVYIGATPVSKVYLGSTLVADFSGGGPPPGPTYTTLMQEGPFTYDDFADVANNDDFELGIYFQVLQATTIYGVRIRGSSAMGALTNREWTIWDADDSYAQVATGSLPDSLTVGWDDYLFDTPVALGPGNYVISYEFDQDGSNSGLDLQYNNLQANVDAIAALGNGVIEYGDASNHVGYFNLTPGSAPSSNTATGEYGVEPIFLTDMPAGVLDDFNRADGSIGSPWNSSTLWNVSSNQAVSASGFNPIYYDVDLGSGDHYIEVDAVNWDGNTYPGIFVRGSDPSVDGNGYHDMIYAQMYPAGVISLYRYDGGSYAAIGIGSISRTSGSYNARLRLEVEGDTVRLIEDDVEVISGLHGMTAPGANRVGFTGTTGATVDNFEAGPL